LRKILGTGLWRREQSLRFRFLAILCLVAVLPVLTLGCYGFWIERRRSVEKELGHLANDSHLMAASIDKYLASKSQLIRHLSEAPELSDYLGSLQQPNSPARSDTRRASVEVWLRRRCEISSELTAAVLVASDGRCLASSSPEYLGRNYAFRAFFQDAIRGETRLSDWHLGLADKAPSVYIAAPVRSHGRIAGVLTLKIKVDRILNLIAEAQRSNRVAFIVNRDGIVLAHSNPELSYTSITPMSDDLRKSLESSRQFLDRTFPVLDLNDAFRNGFSSVLATGSPRIVRYDLRGQTRVAALCRLDEESWVFGTAIAESAIYSSSLRILLGSVAIALLTLLLSLAVGLFFADRIFRPLDLLSNALERFSGGSTHTDLEVHSKDEVGRLALRFNLMTQVINEQREALRTKVDQLEGILPICSNCKKIRNKEGDYQPIEEYISSRSSAQFTHGICQDCYQALYPEIFHKLKASKIKRGNP